ncbi:MAG: 3-isopropylmalate dehydratase small subunit [Chloroflexota bacterium]
MVLYGHTIRVDGAVTTDMILAPEHRESGDPALLAAMCLASVDPAIAERVREGDVLVTGAGCGAGEGQEEAALALQAAGFAAVVCSSADPGFSEQAARLGLPVLECRAALELADGALVRIDLASGRIEDRAHGTLLQAEPLPEELIAAVRQAQLFRRMRQVVDEEGLGD